MAEDKKKRGPGRPPGSKNKSKKSASTSNNKRSSSNAENAEQKQIREMQEKRNSHRKLIDEIWGIAIFAIGVFLIFTMKSDSTGSFGHGIHNILRGLFGGMSYVLPYFLILVGICLFLQKLQHLNARTASLTTLIYFMMCALNGYRFVDSSNIKFGFGDILIFYRDGVKGYNAGAVGMELSNILVKLIGKPGLIILGLALIFISVLLVANTPISKQIHAFREAREEKRLIREFEHSGGTIGPSSSFGVNKTNDVDGTSNRTDKNEQMQFGADEQVVVNSISTASSAATDYSFSGNMSHVSNDELEEEPTSGLFGRMLAKHLNSRKERAQANDIGASRIQPAKESSSIGVSQIGEASGKKTAAGFPDEDTRRELADMLDNGSDFGGDESGAYEGYRGRNASDIGRGLGTGDDLSSRGQAGYGLDGAIESSSSGSTGLCGYDGISDDRIISPKSRLGLDDSNAGKTSRSRIATYRGPGTPEFDGLKAQEAALKSGLGVSAGIGAATAAGNLVSGKSTEDAVYNQKEDTRPTKADHDEIAKQVEEGQAKKESKYVFPSVDLLNRPKPNNNMMSGNQLEERARLLEQTLNDFNVEAKVLNVTQGASVTRYEVQPATGVKVSKITGLADDIALNMRAKSIRIEAPIPGKAAVGIEVENEKAAPVLIRELIESNEFKHAKSKISFVVGKDVSGRNVIADLHSMPHMLIAGATGSGKSVCINTIITSFLYKASPDEVKLVLIDPKVVELGSYNGIPHMLIPVVTDPKKAAAALNWAVNEMQQRYNKFAEIGAKDLASYNHSISNSGDTEKVMPQIVIVIDELADLMMAASSQVEEAICRLAQKARAAGMHLIVATQRPSVDVVTGLIKANIPSRIAFSVSSQFDSRTIIDTAGAEKLLGKGDMLFSPVEANKPIRIQGPYISETESAAVIDFVKSQSETEYREDVIQSIEVTDKPVAQESAEDELTEDAIEFILKQKQASVSMLQRRFRIGYNRAARIIDEIEDMGIIGPSDGSRPRQVLMTEEEYYGPADQTTFDSGVQNDDSEHGDDEVVNSNGDF
nr:DNA translocase FtsK [uncultured Mogibacterium sp.]